MSLARWLQYSTTSAARQILYGLILGLSLSWTSSSITKYYQSRRRQRLASKSESPPIELKDNGMVVGVTGLIGNTPLVRINSLSNALGVEILGKAEFLNPGGSVKDRVALRIIDDAERRGLLYPHTGSRIFEGTVGSTGISLTTIARARGYDTTIIMPDDVAEEKEMTLRSLGADIVKVRPASIVDKNQFVNLARQYAVHFNASAVEGDTLSIAPLDIIPAVSYVDSPTLTMSTCDPITSSKPTGYFANQFESRCNYEAHFSGTGPEIYRQTNGHLQAFVAGAGTGGTIAGVGRYLKANNEDIVVALADPEGSGLYNKVKHGVMYDRTESEGTKRRHQVDTVVEGIGINRLTNNFELALPIIDDAFRVSDAEAVSMSRFLVQNDGLFLGSSSACNLVACVKLVRKMGWRDGQRVVTILCDSGSRHHSKFWNDEYLRRGNIPVGLDIIADLLKVLDVFE